MTGRYEDLERHAIELTLESNPSRAEMLDAEAKEHIAWFYNFGGGRNLCGFPFFCAYRLWSVSKYPYAWLHKQMLTNLVWDEKYGQRISG